MATTLAETTRGSEIESIHQGNVAVIDADGGLVAWAGDPRTQAFFRSSAKVFQAVPLIITGAADAFGFTTEELAMACASHNGTARHQEVVTSMLRKIGLTEGDLLCGASPPLDETEQARVTLGLTEPTQVSCECSGEHAGMLAACRKAGWSTENYVDPDHPLQQLIREIVAAGCGVCPSSLAVATDGCSLPTFGAPMEEFAFSYAVVADPAGAQWAGQPEWRLALQCLREAMLLHPHLISGEGEIDTVIMQATNGRVLAKLGAEGLLCLSLPDRRLGIAIHDLAGSTRSLGPAAITVLRELEAIDAACADRLSETFCPPIETFTGNPVGLTRSAVSLERPAALDPARHQHFDQPAASL
jgi:L-asparaginase II